jgi:hypothetical protein
MLAELLVNAQYEVAQAIMAEDGLARVSAFRPNIVLPLTSSREFTN